MNQAEFLDELRGIAQLGLNYARDPYDIARYERILKLAAAGYYDVSGLDPDEALSRFRADLGYITPKVGVDGALFSDDGEQLLLIRRADSGSWALPGGWAELGSTAEDSIARELLEETKLVVDVGPVIAVSSQLPGGENGPHTSIHVLYACSVSDGTPQTTEEASEVAYRRPDDVTDWHADHGTWAQEAMAWRRTRREPA